MLVIRNLDDLKECNFNIISLSIVEKTVLPPVPFAVHKGEFLFDRFFYVVSGKIIFDLDDKTIGFGAGSIVYLPYDITYNSHWDIAENGKYISVKFTILDKDNENISLSTTIEEFIYDYNQKYYKMFKSMADTWSNGKNGYKMRNYSQFYNLLYEMYLDRERDKLKTEHSKIYKSVLYLENNYTSDVTTVKLAEMSCLKECMYRRIFKQIKGVSPITYRNSLRITKAYEMLTTGSFTVIEAMLASGFSDTSYFYKLFIKQYGIAPSKCIPYKTN